MKRHNRIIALLTVTTIAVSGLVGIINGNIFSYKDNTHVALADSSVTTVSSMGELKTAVASVSSGSTIQFSNDVISNVNDDYVAIDSGKTLTIDINGHLFGRYGVFGRLIKVTNSSNLTITDSVGTGLLTGGNYQEGGFIYTEAGTTLNLVDVSASNNSSSSAGGFAYIGGALTISGGNYSKNSSNGVGGVFYFDTDATFSISGTKFHNNSSIGCGGVIFGSDFVGDSSIAGSEFLNNHCNDVFGGAIFAKKKDGETFNLSISNTSFKNCYSSMSNGYGGALFLASGKANISSSRFEECQSVNGGAIKNVGDMTLNNTDFVNNKARADGGAIVNTGSLTITGGNYSNNSATNSGGVIDAREGSVTINSGSFTNNSALKANGGAINLLKQDATVVDIYVKGVKTSITDHSSLGIEGPALQLCGGDFTYNYAEVHGGAIYDSVASDTALIMSGCPKIYNNSVTSDLVGDSLYLKTGALIVCNYPFESGATIEVTKEDVNGALTKGYGYRNPDRHPSLFFRSPSYIKVNLVDGEAYLSPKPDEGNEYEEFLSWKDNVELGEVNSTNWMSGISGDIPLNQISIPGAHDCGMRKVHSSSDTIGQDFGGKKYAKTQEFSIPEMMNMGYRIFDVRLNNHVATKDSDEDWHSKGDGVNLYICHGKNAYGGTYWAEDTDGEVLTLQRILDYSKNFLKEHPTETLILDFAPETCVSDDKPIIYQMLYDTIKKDLEQINPRTGEGYYYLEDGEFGKAYKSLPRLRDARGKILLECTGSKIIGGMVNESKFTDVKYNLMRPEGSYKNVGDERIRYTNDFYSRLSHTFFFPENYEQIETRIGTNLITAGTNCAPYILDIFPNGTPEYWAGIVHPGVYGEGKSFTGRRGLYVGWIRGDFCSDSLSHYIYDANFVDTADIFVNIKVVDGLLESIYPSQSYDVLLNKPITLPDSIYTDYDENYHNNEFVGWRVYDKFGTHDYNPGDVVVASSDMTIEARWSNIKLLKINVNWADADDADGLRPDSITISDGEYAINVTKDEGWQKVALMQTDKELIIDADIIRNGSYTYTCDVTDAGYTFTVTHLSTETVTIKGKITWEDDDDKGGYRPSLLTARLSNYSEDIILNAANNWSYELVLPKYSGETKIDYHLENIIGIPPGFELGMGKYDATITLKPESLITGSIKVNWDDGDDPNRPTSVHFDFYEVKGTEHTHALSDDVTKDNEWGYDISYASMPNVFKEGYTYELITSYVEGYEISTTVVENNFIVTFTKSDIDPAVLRVRKLINDIGEVYYGDDCKNRIDTAREAYDALETDEQRNLVNNYKVLTKDEETYAVLEEVYGVSKDVNNLISNLGDYEYTEAYKAKLDEIRTAYDALFDDQKVYVTLYDEFAAKEYRYNLDSSKISACTTLDNYLKDESLYSGLYEEARKVLVEEAKTNINNSTTIEEVNAYLAISKSNIDTLKAEMEKTQIELNNAKANAINDIASYKGEEGRYDEYNTARRSEIVNSTSVNISKASSIEEVNALLTEAKAKIDALKTVAQQAEEAAQLATYKENIIDEVNAIYEETINGASYSEEEKAELLQLKDKTIEKINNAASIEEVEIINTNYKAAVKVFVDNNVKTNNQMFIYSMIIVSSALVIFNGLGVFFLIKKRRAK